MYAAEWPCCHDPLRFSLGTDDFVASRNNPSRTDLLTYPLSHSGRRAVSCASAPHTQSLPLGERVGAFVASPLPRQAPPSRVCSVRDVEGPPPPLPSPSPLPAIHQSSSSDKSNPLKAGTFPLSPPFPFSMARQLLCPSPLVVQRQPWLRAGVDSPPTARTRRLPPSLFLCSSVGPDVGLLACLPLATIACRIPLEPH